MLKQLLRSRPGQHIARLLYNRIVEQARQPWFYTTARVPDTLEGRFDMVVLHAVLVFRRLEGEDPEQRLVHRRLFDHMMRDIDHNYRELGVSDMSMGKSMKRVTQALNGRLAAYSAGLAANDPKALAEAVWRNLYAAPAAPELERLMVSYIRLASHWVEQISTPELLAGHLRFPDPAALRLPLAASAE